MTPSDTKRIQGIEERLAAASDFKNPLELVDSVKITDANRAMVHLAVCAPSDIAFLLERVKELDSQVRTLQMTLNNVTRLI